MDKIEIFWLAATILMFILEAVTVNLVSVWFALGALGALIAALLGAHLWLQIVIFFLVTILTLILTRPLVKSISTRITTSPQMQMPQSAKSVLLPRISTTLPP